MGTKTTHFCDRCKADVKRPMDLTRHTYKEKDHEGVKFDMNSDLCPDCHTKVMGCLLDKVPEPTTSDDTLIDLERWLLDGIRKAQGTMDYNDYHTAFVLMLERLRNGPPKEMPSPEDFKDALAILREKDTPGMVINKH